MQGQRQGRSAARAFTVAALVLAVVVAALLMFRSGGYEVALTLSNASQLVKGDEVKVGGVPVGLVKKIELADDSRARLILSVDGKGLAPLHRGTKAFVRATSLSGIANRYVALEPGPDNAPEIPDGGAIRADDARATVDLDAVLDTLDPATQRDLRRAVRSSAGIFRGRLREANAGLAALNPALSQSDATAREVIADRRSFSRFLVESAGVVSTVAAGRPDLDALTTNALSAVGGLANRSTALDASLGRLPALLRRTNTTLVDLRATLREARPAVAEARPATRPLATFLERLSPVARDARPVVARLRSTLRAPGPSNDLADALAALPGVAARAVPAFRSTAAVLRDAQPVVSDARPFTPDLIGGLMNGFGGATGGYYDANGHYARISFQASVYSLTGAGSLVALPQLNGLTGYRKGITQRCPGAATQPAPDRSNPFTDGRSDFPCLQSDNPR